MRIVIRVSLLSAALVMTGCASREATAPVTSSASVAPVAAALAPALYMQLAASSALFAVRASELAAERSSDPRLRSLAQTIAADQRGVGSQLNFAGRRLDLLPSAALTDTQAADLERLRSSANVETTYRQLMDPVLSQALQAHSAFAARGASPTLKPVARMAAPATRRNLQQLRGR
jgi:predicted outer membrane protein